MGTSKEKPKEAHKDITPAKGKPKHTGKHQLGDREEERRGQRDTGTNKSDSNMQEEPAPQVTPTQNDKPEQAAVKASTVAAATPITHQANNESPSISKSSDNTRDRMEKNSPNRPKSRTKHNPKDHLPSEDTKMAAKPQHQEPPLPPKANTLILYLPYKAITVKRSHRKPVP